MYCRKIIMTNIFHKNPILVINMSKNADPIRQKEKKNKTTNLHQNCFSEPEKYKSEN